MLHYLRVTWLWCGDNCPPTKRSQISWPKSTKKNYADGYFARRRPIDGIQHAGVKILSLSDSFSIFAVEVPAIKSLNLHNFVVDWSLKKSKFPHLQDLDIGAIDYAKVTILLGSDHQEAHEELEVRKPSPSKNGPWAIKSVFGWCVSGSLATKADLRHPLINMIRKPSQAKDNLNDAVQQLLSLESFGTHPNVTVPIRNNNARAIRLLDDHFRLVGDRYEAPLLWTSDDVTLPNNYPVTLSRFNLLDRKLKSDPVKAKAYQGTIDDYIAQNHARKLTENNLKDQLAGLGIYLIMPCGVWRSRNI